MIVFKTFWNVVKKYKGTIILYTVLLIIFGGMNMATSDSSTNFVASKPDILIVNQDVNEGLTKNLINYLDDNTNIVNIKNDENSINDALFYRDVNYIIYIPNHYREDVLKGLKPIIKVKSTGDYQASFAEMILSRYIKIQTLYLNIYNNEKELITAINDNLDSSTSIHITSKLDTSKTTKAAFYFNFASYSIMAVVIFIICLVLSSFHERTINKRTIVSSMNYKKYNSKLLLASFIYSLLVWLLFVLLGIILLGDIIFSIRGLIFVINAFVFTFCSLTIALLISTLINNKNAVNGIVNVVALGSAFLCGAFVPAEWLPQSVLNLAHILPAYWYIRSNDILKTIEIINIESLTPVIINMFILGAFSLIFIVINNRISKMKQRVG